MYFLYMWCVSLVLAILKNCLKRLSEAHTTRTKRPPTSDKNPPITKRIRTNETPKCLAIVADCRRKQGGRNQGSSQLTVWQWLTHVECKLTSGLTNHELDGGYPFLHSTTSTVSHYVLHVHSVQWNAGMGNTDTLHPNSCSCSFSILTSRIIFLLIVSYIM